MQVRGTDRTLLSEVVRAMESKAGTPFSAEGMRRDIQAIAHLGYYNPLTIRISAEEAEGGVRLLVDVEENPVVESISIVGNVKYTAERLRREIDVQEGAILPVAPRSQIVRSLRDFYSRGGYKSTQVDVEVQPAEEEGRVRLVITIDEGEKIKIKDLILRGNSHFPSWQIRTWVSNSGSWLFFDNYFDNRTFDDDLRTIEERYRDAGFLDAKAQRGEFLYDEQKAIVSPVILIDEGPRYRVASVAVTGHTLFLEREVRRPFETTIGKHFKGDSFREALRKLRRLYGDEGYVNAEFNARFEKDPERASVKLLVDITENDVVYVGNIYVQKQQYDYDFDLNWLEEIIEWSSPGVKDETVRREVALEPGQKYRTVDELKTERRLRNLGFFRNVAVERQPTADPRVDDVVVRVEEDPSAGYVSVTAGVGEVTGPSVGVNYVNPNLFGEARVLKAGATVGPRVRSFSVGYLDRHFRGSDTSLETSLYRDFVGYRGYGQRIYGASGEAGRPFSEHVKGFMRVRVERVNLIRDDDDMVEDMGSYGVYAVRLMVVRDMMNDRRWPTSGYRVSGGIEPGFARNSFVKFLHSLEWVRALDREEDWVYYYAHNFGLMPNDAQRVGISERFFVGGTSTLRGFQPHGIGPRDDGERRVHIGGATMLTQRHELRRRLTKFLSARAFVDAGMLGEDSLHFGSPRVGTGGGVSFDLGALTVDLDLAAAVVKRRNDHTRVLHFRIRSNF